MAPFLLMSIAEALVRMIFAIETSAMRIFGNYSNTSKLTHVCKSDVALGQYCISLLMIILVNCFLWNAVFNKIQLWYFDAYITLSRTKIN